MKLLLKYEKKIASRSSTEKYVGHYLNWIISLKKQIDNNLCFLETSLAAIPSPNKEPVPESLPVAATDTPNAPTSEVQEQQGVKRAREDDEFSEEPMTVEATRVDLTFHRDEHEELQNLSTQVITSCETIHSRPISLSIGYWAPAD